jgi:hypothetical protein
MPDIRSPWINVIAAAVGGVAMGIGISRLTVEFTMIGAVWAVLGFLILGWAILDRRRYRRGTGESEVDGGRTIE